MNRNLTVKELQKILMAQLLSEMEEGKIFQKRLNVALGSTETQQDAIFLKLNKFFFPVIMGAVAERLLVNQTEVPLLTPEDIDPLMQSLLGKKLEDAIKGEDSEFSEKIVHSYLHNIEESLIQRFTEQKDPYGDYWKWINIALSLAVEKKVSADSLFSDQENRDEITRRRYTKKEYITDKIDDINKICTVDAMKGMFVQPALDLLTPMLNELDEDEKEEALREIMPVIENQVMPQLEQYIKTFREVKEGWLEEEVARIYG